MENLKKQQQLQTKEIIDQIHNKIKSGLVQAKQREEISVNISKEKDGEFARLKTDTELNELLKAQELMDDPLIEMKRKKNKGMSSNSNLFEYTVRRMLEFIFDKFSICYQSQLNVK